MGELHSSVAHSSQSTFSWLSVLLTSWEAVSANVFYLWKSFTGTVWVSVRSEEVLERGCGAAEKSGRGDCWPNSRKWVIYTGGINFLSGFPDILHFTDFFLRIKQSVVWISKTETYQTIVWHRSIFCTDEETTGRWTLGLERWLRG